MSANQIVDILTPVGRLVQGSCFEGDNTNMDGAPLLVKSGPNVGQPRTEYFIAIAIPKTDPALPAMMAKIQAEARRGFPQFFDAGGNCILPTFAWKIIDGDSQVPNTRGVKPCTREGFPGHMVFNMSGGFAPKCYTTDTPPRAIVDPKGIKRGDYIRVYGSVAANMNATKPGLYLNHNMIQLIGHGQEIVTGPQAADVFAGAVALPPGASATPVAPAAALAPVGMPGAAPAPAWTPPAAAAPAPAHDFLKAAPPVAAAPAYAPPPPPPPAPVNYRAGDGNVYTREQLTAAGYPAAAIDALPRA